MSASNIGSLTKDVTKTFKTRIIQKHDTEANWQKATNFVPKKGEMIVYDIDSNHNYERIKIGDGEHIPNDLPFVTDNYYTKSETDAKLNGKQAQLNTTQLAAVNSGITNDKVTKYDNYQSQIDSKYEKPNGGIPKTDLSSAVQASLGKADSALQTHQTITTGSVNGTIAVGGTNVAVKGLKALAYKDSLTKTDVGLGNVDNTSDEEKPVSTATQAALDKKQASLTATQLNAVNSGITSGKVSTYDGYQAKIDAKYTKPTGGIPKTDLASSVQTSLGKADTALQTHQTITTGSANGTIAVGGTDVHVKGLGSLAYKNSLTKSDVGLGNVVNAGQDSTPTANSSNYITSGGVKNYVDTAISGVSQFKYEVVASLPTASANTMGKIYLVAHSHSSNDSYDEYITLESGTTTKTYSWEKIGNTDIDLSNYVNNLSGTANSGVVTNITKSGNALTVTSSNLSGTKTASNGKYISGITQDKTGKITSVSEETLPSNTAHSHTAGTGLNVSGSGGVSGTTTYSLKVASSSEIGGVKPGTTSGKTYGVDVADDGTMTVSVPWTDNNTTYSAGTHISINGTTINASWPTASDSGYAGINKTGTVTSVAVKMNGSVKGTVTSSGTIDLGTVITAHQDISGKQDSLSTVQLAATNSGITAEKVTTYNGYQAKIDAKYTKPTTGIPKTDLASAVQTSLGKADTAVQSVTTGSANGTISVGGTNVAVKGLGTAAYKADTYFATATQVNTNTQDIAVLKEIAGELSVLTQEQVDSLF